MRVKTLRLAAGQPGLGLTLGFIGLSLYTPVGKYRGEVKLCNNIKRVKQDQSIVVLFFLQAGCVGGTCLFTLAGERVQIMTNASG